MRGAFFLYRNIFANGKREVVFWIEIKNEQNFNIFFENTSQNICKKFLYII